MGSHLVFQAPPIVSSASMMLGKTRFLSGVVRQNLDLTFTSFYENCQTRNMGSLSKRHTSRKCGRAVQPADWADEGIAPKGTSKCRPQ